MYRKEINERSPLRILEESIHGGLGQGNLGVIMSRAGAGSTAFLVQIGLDDVMRDRGVLHISLCHSLDHVLSWYEALFDDLARYTNLEEREQVRERISRYRVIQTYPDNRLTPDRLEQVIKLYSRGIEFSPRAVLIDGWNWNRSPVEVAAELGAFTSITRQLGAELWMTAETNERDTGTHPRRITPPCDPFERLISVGIFLEPEGSHIKVRLLKDHDEPRPPVVHLQLNCDTMRLVRENEDDVPVRLSARGYTLLSGGSKGTESLFGQCAEDWGLHETNFSFEGHETERTRGLVLLSSDQLHEGEVSHVYVKAQLNRSFPNTPTFRKILQSIWHQVATAGEVFVVGTIQEDKTVKGGTGWAAELARHMQKPLYIFDQEKDRWFRSIGSDWENIEPPSISRARFAGTGTRLPTERARSEIKALFERSFTAKSDRPSARA